MNTTTSTNFTQIRYGCMKIAPWLPPRTFKNLPMIIFQAQFLLVFVVTQVLHFFFKFLGIPPQAAQIVAGILLSPHVLVGKFKFLRQIHNFVFPDPGKQVWNTLASLGYALSLFIIGIKMDFSMIRKNGRKPFVIGLLVLIVPGLVNWATAEAYARATGLKQDKIKMVDLSMVASAITLTPFPVIAILLSDLKLLNSELGRLALSSAIVSEVGSIFNTVVTKALGTMTAKGNKVGVLINMSCTIVFILGAIFIVRPWMKYIIKQTPKGRPVRNDYLIVLFVLVLVGGLLTDGFGQFVILGVFIVGVVVPDGPPLGSTLVHKFEVFILEVLHPFFITVTVMKADLSQLGQGGKSGYGNLLVTFTGLLTKIIICLVCGSYYNMTLQDSLALGAIMSSKGNLDIAIYDMFKADTLISPSSFAYLIVVATILAIVIPIFVKQIYNPMRKYANYRRRDVMHCKHETPLRILACISRRDNISSITNLLNIAKITKDSPMIVDALHLIKLVGRSQPIFISHNLQTKKVSKISYSDDVIWVLKAQTNRLTEGLTMRYYTAVSPPKAMHEDICTLALDNLTSLIVLPFHRKLNVDGTIDFEDYRQRALNISVLERAPCSVGILVDRGSWGPTQSDQVATVGVIFIGGKDDQEAVAFARRIARGQGANVAVIRLVALGERDPSFLDSTVLSGIKEEYSNLSSKFKYVEVVVQEGAHTAKVLRDIVGDFSLIIVGRRYNLDCTQTSGLQEWSEVPELGVLGDILASSEIQSRTSVLVIQQQKQWTGKEKIDYK